MNKKFLSAILFGALMVTSTGTFVSCKDYDDDIDSINKELTDIKSQIAALQAKVDAGKWITSVSSTANGVSITLNDGQTLTIANGKDGQNGAQGAAGKDGSVVEVKEGVLYINGEATEIKVAEEAPAALPCVKVEDGELMVLGAEGEYVATGIKAGSVTAAKTNGVWTITIDGETIVVPGSAALTSIAIQGEKNLTYSYGIVSKATPWGWSADGGKTYDEEMPAGFYTRLSKDVDVLLNPAEADGTAFTYTFKNSKGEAADVTFFGEARPSTTVLTTRAASANGLWTLPAAVSKFDAANITELRNELYLNFKQNDGKAYAMTLEAVDGLGNVSTRSNYDYTLTLAQAGSAVSVNGGETMYCLIGQEYFPSVEGAVYDYKIRVAQTSSNLRLAKAFGIAITEDEKGFSASNDAAVFNAVKFELAYVTIGGQKGTKSFSVSFTDGLVASENLRAEALSTNLDATLANNSVYVTTKAGYAPDEIADRLANYNKTSKYATDKVFVLKHTYDLSTQYASLNDDAKLMFTEYVNKATAELFGGEAGNVTDNYNTVEGRNTQLLKNIKWNYNTTKNTLEVRFYVSSKWARPSDFTGDWIEYSNFQLNTAYQLNLTVKDALSDAEVATIELPFEFAEPTLDIEQVDGEFTKWGSVHVGYDANNNKVWERALYVYGIYSNGQMRLPLYDSFAAWKAKGSETGVTRNYQAYVDNAEYYSMTFATRKAGTEVFGKTAVNTWFALDNALDYSAQYAGLKTYADNNVLVAAAASTDVDGKQQLELRNPVEVVYKHYGVYLAKGTVEKNADGDVVTKNGKIDNDDFHLVYASWLKHSTLEMAAENYNTARGSHVAVITNDDLNFTTPKGDAFYLFNGISASGKVVERAALNATFDEIDQHPFSTIAQLFASGSKAITAKNADGAKQDGLTVINGGVLNSKDVCTINLVNGEVSLDLTKEQFAAHTTNVLVYYVSPLAQAANDAVATGVRQAFEGGMVVVLPKNFTDQESAIVTITLEDKWGYKNSVDINVTKLGK